MAISPAKNCHKGLTLIEVLVALAIVSIAITAIIKAASENIRSTNYLQTKTIALWVAQEVTNEVRAGIIKSPGLGQPVRQSTTMLQQRWYWELSEEATANTVIKRVIVKVYNHEPDNETASLITLESYITHAAN